MGRSRRDNNTYRKEGVMDTKEEKYEGDYRCAVREDGLAKRLRDAIDLATTYLDDGAPYSAYRALRDAIDAERGRNES